jgi:hypothetical protein
VAVGHAGSGRKRALTNNAVAVCSPGLAGPALRSEAFYGALPEVIRRVEAGEIPAGQRGDYDLNDALVSAARGR